MGRNTDHRGVTDGDIAATAEQAPRKAAAVLPLHICPCCGSGLVQPTCWEPAADRTLWRVWRRCPECEWTSCSIHGAAEIDAFDDALDLGARELAGELRSLEHANMTAMAGAFFVALRDDLIGADDFV
jgi:hypothetical protein